MTCYFFWSAVIPCQRNKKRGTDEHTHAIFIVTQFYKLAWSAHIKIRKKKKLIDVTSHTGNKPPSYKTKVRTIVAPTLSKAGCKKKQDRRAYPSLAPEACMSPTYILFSKGCGTVGGTSSNITRPSINHSSS